MNQAQRARMHTLLGGARLKQMYSLSAADPRCLDGRPDRSWPPQIALRGGQTIMPVLTHWLSSELCMPLSSSQPLLHWGLSCELAACASVRPVCVCVCVPAWPLSWHGKPCTVHQALHPCRTLILQHGAVIDCPSLCGLHSRTGRSGPRWRGAWRRTRSTARRRKQEAGWRTPGRRGRRQRCSAGARSCRLALRCSSVRSPT